MKKKPSHPMLRKYTVTIEDYSSDASGICRINGRVVFVPKAIPGEEWERSEEQIVQEFPVEAYDLSHALETAEAAYKQGELVVQPSAPNTRLIMARHNKTGKTTGWREF